VRRRCARLKKRGPSAAQTLTAEITHGKTLSSDVYVSVTPPKKRKWRPARLAAQRNPRRFVGTDTVRMPVTIGGKRVGTNREVVRGRNADGIILDFIQRQLQRVRYLERDFFVTLDEQSCFRRSCLFRSGQRISGLSRHHKSLIDAGHKRSRCWT
jgi:hypothetical protein